jgi:hypothetical protein
MTVRQITEKQKKQLLQVKSSTDGIIEYRPCQVTLKSGETFDNVYVQEEQTYLAMWGLIPDADRDRRYLLIEEVVKISERPNRLRPELANKLYEAGESGMGYCVYKLVFYNGKTIDVCTGNAVDFVPLPEGLTTEDIKEVVPHQASRVHFLRAPMYYWCLFKGQVAEVYY